MFHRLKSYLAQRLRAAQILPDAGFDPAAVDAAAWAAEIAGTAPATTRYVIHFTPRSGSTWLTDIAEATGRLSKPGECFNPQFLPHMARRMNAANMEEYVQILLRRRNTRDVFGCEVTWHQIQRSFGGDAAFLHHFADAHAVWLLREDIVAQAVSLSKKRQTRIGHSVQAGSREHAEADRAFVYKPKEIREFIGHVLRAEQGSEALFARSRVAPLRMSYEHNMAMGPVAVLNALAHHIGADPITQPLPDPAHRKIGTGRNVEFAERFRAENQRYLDGVDAARAARLAAVDRALPDRLPAAYRPSA